LFDGAFERAGVVKYSDSGSGYSSTQTATTSKPQCKFLYTAQVCLYRQLSGVCVAHHDDNFTNRNHLVACGVALVDEYGIASRGERARNANITMCWGFLVVPGMPAHVLGNSLICGLERSDWTG
jgi:hypothetical protein